MEMEMEIVRALNHICDALNKIEKDLSTITEELLKCNDDGDL